METSCGDDLFKLIPLLEISFVGFSLDLNNIGERTYTEYVRTYARLSVCACGCDRFVLFLIIFSFRLVAFLLIDQFIFNFPCIECMYMHGTYGNYIVYSWSFCVGVLRMNCGVATNNIHSWIIIIIIWIKCANGGET